VRLWDVASGESLTAAVELSAPARAVAAAELYGEYHIAAGGLDQVVRVWNPAGTGAPVTLSSSGKDTTAALAIGQAGDVPIVVSGNRSIRIWDLAAAALIREIPVQATSLALGAHNGNPVLVSGGSDNLVRRWHPMTGALVAMMHGHRGPIRTVAVGTLNDVCVVASAGSDATIRLWDAQSGTAIGDPFRGHSDPITSVAIGKLGDRLVVASGSHDKTLRIWDVLTGQQMQVFNATATVHSVLISANRWVVAGTDRGILSLSLRSAAADQ
jgi:WD40 repeat protein